MIDNDFSDMKSRQFNKSQKGASLVEYVILLSLISVVVIAAVRDVGLRAGIKYELIGDCLEDASQCGDTAVACGSGNAPPCPPGP